MSSRPRSIPLPARLAPVDRWLQRWAVGQGSGLGTADEHITRVPPLSIPDLITTDQIVLRAPRPWPDLVHGWYRSENAAAHICRRCGLAEGAFYPEWIASLGYFLCAFSASSMKLPAFPSVDFAPDVVEDFVNVGGLNR